ncbi:NADH-quinone oxidoreductase subunit NuoE [Nocardioides sp.]|uniref:NADH-quinone oxidoreductase subunit NuoE n=1 Tax=Nocardioides sp. TaxID=35761 RepID=UPI00356611FA
MSALTDHDGSTGLSETTYAELREIAARYPQARSGLLPMLHLVQSAEGRITPAGIEACAEILDITAAEVSGVATFYTMYKRKPVGDYHVGVCTNTLCAVMGGDAIFERLKEHLDVGNDETTEDGKVTLEHIECNAACDFAPVMTVNWEFMDNMTPESATQLVDDLRSGVEVSSTRGPRICTWREAERVLAGFPDGRHDEGPSAGGPSLVGRELARANGWTAPEAPQPAALGGPASGAEGAAEAADTSRAESETKVEESGAEAVHEDDTANAKGDE